MLEQSLHFHRDVNHRDELHMRHVHCLQPTVGIVVAQPQVRQHRDTLCAAFLLTEDIHAVMLISDSFFQSQETDVSSSTSIAEYTVPATCGSSITVVDSQSFMPVLALTPPCRGTRDAISHASTATSYSEVIAGRKTCEPILQLLLLS